MIAVVIGAVVVTELAALLWLATTIKTNKNFWVQKANESGEITYLALGDSAAQSIGATSPMRGYVGLIAKRLEKQTGKTVRVINVSKTGAKMSDYLNEQAPKIKDFRPDYVTIEIGANDVMTFESTKFRREFKEVLQSLPDGTYVANMPLFNSRPSSTSKAEQASEIIQEELMQFPKLVFADLQKQTSENKTVFGFAPDFFHPNNISYRHWADAFWLPMQRVN